MYNVQKMVETGRQAIQRNPRRDVRARDFLQVRDSNQGDDWGMMLDAYYLGVAVGMRIAEAEQAAGAQE